MQTTLSTLLRRTRQHHAIEHATIHLLAARFARTSIVGLSDPWGFTLYGDLPEEAVREAVREALLRLQAGEAKLAIHPNCGTNLTTSMVMVTAAAMLGTIGRGRHFMDRLTTTSLLVGVALFLSQPLGMHFQRYTTLPHVTDRWLVGIEPILKGNRRAYRITLE
jgi:hypothetical protein